MHSTLLKEHYVDKYWFNEESKKIFHNNWMCVGRIEDFENTGDFKLIDIAGQSILLIKNNDNIIRGFFNFCKHRGCELLDSVDGDREGNIKHSIRCPYHSWVYNLNGELTHTPHVDIDKNDKQFHLNRVGIDFWAGFLFINTGKKQDSFTDYLGEVPSQLKRYPINDLRSCVDIQYSVECNWKVILENYNECYHCAGVHPELCEIVPAFRKKGGNNLDWENGVPHKKGANTFTMSGVTDREPFPGLNQFEKERHFGQAIYPNLLISLAMDHVAVFIIKPVSENLTDIDFRIFFHPNEIQKKYFNPDDARELWHITNQQDWKICEKVQRGMNSIGFEQGYYAEMEDENLDVKNYILDKLSIQI